MATLGNVIWFVLCGGFFAAIAWVVSGILLCVSIVGIPAGVAAFRIAGFAAFPFGKELVDARMLGEKRITGTTLMNVLWFLLGGWWLAVLHCIAGLWCFVSCILVLPALLGAPAWGIAHFRLASVSLAPLGKRTVPKGMAEKARARYYDKKLDEKVGG